jgi:hypothetical protein
MRILKLTHPVHGLVAEQVVTGKYQVSDIQKIWRYRYGKKIFECEISTVVIPNKKTTERKRSFGKIVNIKTGEVYKTRKDAMKELGLSPHQIYTHLYRKLKREWYYKVRWA